MSNNEAQRLAEVVGEVADEFHHNAKNFTKGSLAQIEHHKYRDDLNAASDMLGRIAELETERDALKAERNSAVKLCREHNLCLCNFSQKLAGDGCFICR